MAIVPKIPLKKSGPPEGFMRWMNSFCWSGPKPRDFEFIETWSEFTGARVVMNPAEIPPEMNVYGLYWRPVKSFGEEAH